MTDLRAGGRRAASAALFSAFMVASCSKEPRLLQGDNAPSLACESACPAGQKCRVATGACVFGGIATCAACADGYACSPAFEAPTCVRGTCKAPADFPNGTVKIVSLAVAPRDRGCDLDGDGKPDNQFSTLLKQIDLNAEIAYAVATDRVTALFEPSRAGWGSVGDTFGVSMWFGSLAPQSRSCALTDPAALCTYQVSRKSLDPASSDATCQTWLTFPTVGRASAPGRPDHLASSDQSAALEVVVPTDSGSWLLQLLRARIEADVYPATVSGPGLGPRLEGRLCAAIPKSEWLLAVDTVPPDTLAKFGGPSLVRMALDLNLREDIDADGDGRPESISAALDWTAVPARIVGYSPTSTDAR